MTLRVPLDDFLRGRIIGCLECGRTQLEVSEEFGIAQSVISRLWQHIQDDRNVSRRYSTGRVPPGSAHTHTHLVVTAKRNRRNTSSDLPCQLSSATGTTVSRLTVYGRLEQIGLCARRPVKCVPLTATHCRQRLPGVESKLVQCFLRSPGLDCSLILTRLSYRERQVLVTPHENILTVSVVQDFSFGEGYTGFQN
ncbi:HTH_Tnp_Tc3_2 domain-containing protein [Trichonephila clavipes]|nr:HTH_Tnp_Tc3_2 domain-containing protein [Trichonephila clavipes]